METSKPNEFAKALSRSDFDLWPVAYDQRERFKKTRRSAVAYLAGGLIMLGTTAYTIDSDSRSPGFPAILAGDALIAGASLEVARRESKKAGRLLRELDSTVSLLEMIHAAKE